MTQWLCDAEPELVERVTQVVSVMAAGGVQPSSSVVLAFFVVGAALLMRQEYKPEQVRLVLDGVLPLAESVRDELLTVPPAPLPGPQAPHP